MSEVHVLEQLSFFAMGTSFEAKLYRERRVRCVLGVDLLENIPLNTTIVIKLTKESRGYSIVWNPDNPNNHCTGYTYRLYWAESPKKLEGALSDCLKGKVK